ncbi:OpgC domain-containing protein [Terrarubrum flagellatum]|uniref:OpgC family protein n=1 Tax=Terrirubrum flagellatum TaxID=2895980 RepID=UPI0031452607
MTSPAAHPEKKQRDVRLDFFRGLAMLIILVAHIPDNSWNAWIPARFGFSSGAEMFVFCSGFASSLAFGSIFVKRGLAMGTARIAHRIWQLYWAQIVLFMVITGVTLTAVKYVPHGAYLEFLSLDWFIANPGEGLLGLLTLRYIPNLFDMLPMYIVILASVPIAMLLAGISPKLTLATSVAVWLYVQATGFNLSSRPGSDLIWYFNPIAWQMLFFTGFGFGMGWIPPPPLRDRRLVIIAALLVVLSIPLTFWGVVESFPIFDELRSFFIADLRPTNLHIVRYLHFFALAYLALSLIEPIRGRLADAAFAKPIIRIGQQTLAVFLSSIVIAWTLGILLDAHGRTTLTVAAANLVGLALLFAVAYVVAWFKSQPWKQRAPATPRERISVPIGLQPAE